MPTLKETKARLQQETGITPTYTAYGGYSTAPLSGGYPKEEGITGTTQRAPLRTMQSVPTGVSTSVPTGLRQTGQRTTTTTEFKPAGPAPELGELPEYKPLEYDIRRVAALTQKKAGPARRSAMRALQQAFSQSYQAKPMRDIAIRNALREYGQAYGQILTGAESAAEAQYGREREEQIRANIANYEAELKKQEINFRSAWDAWLKGGVTTTTSAQEIQYGTPGVGGGGGSLATISMGGQKMSYTQPGIYMGGKLARGF